MNCPICEVDSVSQIDLFCSSSSGFEVLVQINQHLMFSDLPLLRKIREDEIEV